MLNSLTESLVSKVFSNAVTRVRKTVLRMGLATGVSWLDIVESLDIA
jgi:hypothetical protein